MKKIRFTPLILAFIASFSLIFAGCEESGPFEEAGEEIDETVDDVGDELEDAADEVEDETD